MEPRLLLSEIHGWLWEDANGNGSREGGEAPLAGWTVFLDLDEDEQRDAGEPSTASGADGSYSFTALAAGTYHVVQEVPAGWAQLYPALPGADSTFTDLLAGLEGVYECSLDWGDYDNDGDLDLAVLGYTGTEAITRVYRNDGLIFVDSGISLPTLRNGALAWGDYDADGWLDLAISGEEEVEGEAGNVASVYHNDQGTLVAAATLAGVDNSAVAWGDYDADGDLDLAVAGYDGAAAVSTIYRNDSGAFVDVQAGLTGVHRAAAAWGDADGDGDLDLLLSGRTTTDGKAITRLYLNTGGHFADAPGVELPGVYFSAVAWGDYDADGDADIVLAGSGNASNERLAAVYRNDGGGTFTDAGADLVGVGGAAAAWGDYDVDGRLDLALSGYAGDGQRITRVYRNLGGDTFTHANVGLVGVNGGSLSWDDVDGDGYIDMAVAGYSATGAITRVYRNLGIPGPHVVELLVGETATEINFGSYRPATIEGEVWHDRDADGLRGTGEEGLADWDVYLDRNQNTQYDVGEPTTTSDAEGAYRFTGLVPGEYAIRRVDRAGWVDSVPAQGWLAAAATSGQTLSGQDFASYQLAQVGGTVFHDANADGVYDDGEAGLAGWTVFLDTNADGQLGPGEASQATDTYGAFAFTELNPGTYRVALAAQEPWQASTPAGGSYDVQAVSGGVHDESLFGQYKPGSLAGSLWYDHNRNGAADADEALLAGWTVFVDADGDGAPGATETAAVTDAQGAYLFAAVPPGSRDVAVVVQSGWLPIEPQTAAATVAIVSDAEATQNFTFRQPEPEISVWLDAAEILSGQAAAIDFGTITLGDTAAAPTMTFTVRNDGDAALAWTAIDLPAGFSLAAGSATPVPAGQQATFTVRLDADPRGTPTGSITLANDDGDDAESPFSIPVTGQVTAPGDIAVLYDATAITSGQTAAVDLGIAHPAPGWVERIFTVRNEGDEDLALGTLTVTGPAGAQAVGPAATTLAGGQSTTFTLRLPTDTAGNFTADVRLASDDAGGDATENPFVFPIAWTVANASPHANAGADQVVFDEDGSWHETVTLDASASTDDAAIASYTWHLAGETLATGAAPQVDLPIGTHEITLTVTDADGASATDTVTIDVQAALGAALPQSLLPDAPFEVAQGAPYTLAWTGAGDDVQVAVHVLGPTGWQTLADAAPGSAGGVDWDTSAAALGEYRVTMTFRNAAQQTVRTTSANLTLIEALAPIVLAGPGAGLPLYAGDSVHLEWTAPQTGTTVDLLAFGPAGWTRLAADLPETATSYDWDTTAAPAGTYRIFLHLRRDAEWLLCDLADWLTLLPPLT